MRFKLVFEFSSGVVGGYEHSFNLHARAPLGLFVPHLVVLIFTDVPFLLTWKEMKQGEYNQSGEA